MAGNKKPRKAYKPKGFLVDPIRYTLNSIAMASAHKSAYLGLKIQAHSSMTSVIQGKATRDDMDILVNMFNMVDALCRMRIGKEYYEQVKVGQGALRTAIERGLARGDRFILTGPEISAINAVIELHDAQLEVATVGDLGRACDMVANVVKSGGAHRLTSSAAA